MAEKPSPHASDRELMDELEKRELAQVGARRQQGRRFTRILLGLIVVAAVVFFSFRENRELVSSLIHGTPPPAAPARPAEKNPLLKKLDSSDAQLLRELVGFMRSPEPAKAPPPPAEEK